MNEFDNIIITIDNNICKNIANIEDGDRGFHSQNILNNLRNLVEAIDQRIYNDIEPIVPNNYEDIEKSVRYVASRGELRFLSRFHDYLQVSVSHYTPDEEISFSIGIHKSICYKRGIVGGRYRIRNYITRIYIFYRANIKLRAEKFYFGNIAQPSNIGRR